MLEKGATMDADIVVAGVGAVPNVELLEGVTEMAEKPMGTGTPRAYSLLHRAHA